MPSRSRCSGFPRRGPEAAADWSRAAAPGAERRVPASRPASVTCVASTVAPRPAHAQATEKTRRPPARRRGTRMPSGTAAFGSVALREPTQADDRSGTAQAWVSCPAAEDKAPKTALAATSERPRPWGGRGRGYEPAVKLLAWTFPCLTARCQIRESGPLKAPASAACPRGGTSAVAVPGLGERNRGVGRRSVALVLTDCVVGATGSGHVARRFCLSSAASPTCDTELCEGNAGVCSHAEASVGRGRLDTPRYSEDPGLRGRNGHTANRAAGVFTLGVWGKRSAASSIRARPASAAPGAEPPLWHGWDRLMCQVLGAALPHRTTHRRDPAGLRGHTSSRRFQQQGRAVWRPYAPPLPARTML